VYAARLRTPLVSSHGTVSERPLIVLELEDEEGITAFGEAAPLDTYGGVDIDAALAALNRCRPLLEASNGIDRQRLLTRCIATGCPPQALAAIDLALWDLAGQRTGQPVWRLLGADHPTPIPVNATIGAVPPDDAAQAALSAQAEGYCTVKVKVGIGDDLDRIRAIRSAVGPALAIRLDANGAWSVDQAIAMLNLLEPLGIECCEEPVHGVEANGRVAAATAIAVALDETTSATDAFERRVCEAVCLKIAASSGITGLIANAGRARRLGYQVYLASTLDGPLGIAAALHAACAVSVDGPCGLATLGAFDGADDRLPVFEAGMLPPGGAGLGDVRLALYERWAKRLL
jgi:o-succinylbenzoate synthase